MILDRMRLDGKVAFVTGASQGLGLGMAKALAEAGADVAVAYRQHTGVDVQRIELRIIDVEGTIKELNFPDPSGRPD